MNLAHLHLVMNHVPTVGAVAVLGLLLLSFVRRNEHLKHAGLEVLFIITTGLILSKYDVALFGHYLGWTLKGTDPPFRLETVEMEYQPTRVWDTTP